MPVSLVPELVKLHRRTLDLIREKALPSEAANFKTTAIPLAGQDGWYMVPFSKPVLDRVRSMAEAGETEDDAIYRALVVTAGRAN